MYKILILGGTGFVGFQLIDKLREENNYIILMTRNKEKAEKLNPKVDEIIEYPTEPIFIHEQYLKNTDVIINLAGESILGIRWTSSKKKKILESRLTNINLVNESLKHHKLKIPLLIYASATGYYGYSAEDKAVNETSNSGNGFLARVCASLENEVKSGRDNFDRIAIIRLGTVLGREKFIKMISKGFSLPMVGVTIGRGNQWFPYIHIEDVAQGINFIIKNKNLSGPINFVSNKPIKYKDFIQLFKIKKKVRILIKIPDIFGEILFGEMSELILKGIKVSPDKLIKSGYKFKDLENDMDNILKYRSH